jgi:hypothetical protein
MMWKFIVSTALFAGVAQAAPGESYSGSGDQLQIQGMDASAPPEFYIVQPGDTLWEISSTFLGNPYYWPRLWSINDYITNPHWIYPGNRIVFRMGTLIDPPSVDLDANRDGYTVEGLDYEDVGAQCGPNVRFDHHIAATKFMAPAFLAKEKNVEVFGKITKARVNQVLLSEDDLVYIKVDDPDAYECGDILAAYRNIRSTVRHPDNWWQNYGSLYRILGNLRVVHKNGDYLSAVVRDSYVEMKRGDLVGPPMPVTVELEVNKPTGDLEGTVVARMSTEMTLAAIGETVFIDRGRSDGVRVGSSFYVVERRDEMIDKKGPDNDLPPSVIGRVVVVRVDDYTSTAIITDASRSLPDGAEIRTRLN